MPKNVMKLLKPSPNNGRNDFDLSHRHLFTANYGELIPGTCIETVPKDKIILRISDLVRSAPMVTSPFVRAKQHCDIWFVPYNLMWSRFNEFLVDRDEPSSSALKDRLYCPHVMLSDLVDVISDYHAMNYFDIHLQNCTEKVCRNLDLLGIPGTLLHQVSQGDQQYVDKGINLWRLLAYQLIWYREYRQQYYDDGKFLLPSSIASLSNGAAYLFNTDWLQCNTVANSRINSTSYKDLLAAIVQPRYRCWKKDLFTGLIPDSQYGSVSVVDFNDIRLINNATDTLTPQDVAGVVSNSQRYLSLHSSAGVFRSGSSYWNIPAAFDVLKLRKSEAVQKWRERAMLAGNQVQDNFEAHYGVKPKSHMDVHPEHIASFDAPLNVGDVMATAETGASINGVLGDVAGKGIMSFGGDQAIQFETNDFGVIMCIYSILPEAEYNSNGVDRMNALWEREDYFFAEYENLGLEAVDKSVITDLDNQSGILGYAPRYFGYKQKLDRVCGQFQYYQGFNGLYCPWAAPKFDVDSIQVNNPVPLSTLYVNPDILMTNFSYSNDNLGLAQFIVDFYVDCEAIRQMSVSGMPSY